MEDLTLEQARAYRAQYLPPEVQSILGTAGVRLCLVRREPPAYGWNVNIPNTPGLEESVRSQIPPFLADNLVVTVIGKTEIVAAR